jgi:hypothetical protein
VTIFLPCVIAAALFLVGCVLLLGALGKPAPQCDGCDDASCVRCESRRW